MSQKIFVKEMCEFLTLMLSIALVLIKTKNRYHLDPLIKIILFTWEFSDQKNFLCKMGKDMNKERNFVLDLVTFIFHRSTANQTLWSEYFQPQSSDKQGPSSFSYSWKWMVFDQYVKNMPILCFDQHLSHCLFRVKHVTSPWWSFF